jgi:hypothetical protein
MPILASYSVLRILNKKLEYLRDIFFQLEMFPQIDASASKEALRNNTVQWTYIFFVSVRPCVHISYRTPDVLTEVSDIFLGPVMQITA